MMISREEVINLAALARLELADLEVEKLRQDLGSILGYVTRLQVEVPVSSVGFQVRSLSDNILRADDPPHETGIDAERLLTMSPDHRAGYFAVKSIFPNDAN